MQALFFSMSDPLAVVEVRLGSIERWPYEVIIDMFVDEPTENVIKRVAVFLAGNCWVRDVWDA